MSGKAPVLDLDQAIRDAYRNDPKLANGRLSNAQVVDLLEFCGKTRVSRSLGQPARAMKLSISFPVPAPR